jgi:hypothetical protein
MSLRINILTALPVALGLTTLPLRGQKTNPIDSFFMIVKGMNSDVRLIDGYILPVRDTSDMLDGEVSQAPP